MQQHHIHTQQQQDLPLAAWAAIAAGIAYILALNYFPFATITATAAILIPARFIVWLRGSR